MCVGSHKYFNAWSKLFHRSKSSTGMISTCLLSSGVQWIPDRGWLPCLFVSCRLWRGLGFSDRLF